MLVFLVGSRCLGKFVGIGILWVKVGWRAQNLHGPKMLIMENFGGTAASEELRLNIRPCRGPLAARSRLPFHDTWLVETVCLSVQAIVFSAGGVEAGSVTNRNSGKNSTFSVIALVFENRLRYPPVSLFFDMCLTFWLGRGVWENLFDPSFFGTKVGSWLSISWCWVVCVLEYMLRECEAIIHHRERSQNQI